MTTHLRALLALAVVAGGLAGCGNSNSNSTPPPVVVPPTPVATTESKFGSCFATRFDAPANSKATDPVPCPDLAPLSLTTKPTAI